MNISDSIAIVTPAAAFLGAYLGKRASLKTLSTLVHTAVDAHARTCREHRDDMRRLAHEAAQLARSNPHR